MRDRVGKGAERAVPTCNWERWSVGTLRPRFRGGKLCPPYGGYDAAQFGAVSGRAEAITSGLRPLASALAKLSSTLTPLGSNRKSW